jgi:mycothiol synthase
MKVEVLGKDRVSEFIEYCRKHRGEVDDSFLYEENLREFQPGEDDPTYVITGEQGGITAAASLMLNDYYRRGKNARFRIFHSELEDINCYHMLLQAILKHTGCLDSLCVFVGQEKAKVREFMEGLKFNVYRYSFLLVREDLPVPEVSLPEGYEIRSFRAGLDEETWCKIRNAGFAKLKGSETPIAPDMVEKMVSEDSHLEGGMMILYHYDRPVGVVRGSMDEYEASPIMDIGPLAIIPEYQGKGLGRSLLRASLNFAKDKGYKRTVLCVNAENERAKALYLKEGFKEVEAVVCYRYDLI